MDDRKRYTPAEAVITLCRARDNLNAAISELRYNRPAGTDWDTYCMWVTDAANAAEKLREQARRTKRW